MNNTVMTPPGLHPHPPQQTASVAARTRRVGVVDRLALHVGVALIKWGRRPRAVDLRTADVEWSASFAEREESRRSAERVRARETMFSIMLNWR
ncbi:MAG: hypothetical protein RI885_2435 [Actinomycetota bacterium]|jgi:hypothetical protein